MSHDFRAFDEPVQPRSGSGRSVKWIALFCGVALLGAVFCCGGGIWFVNFGLGIVSADIERQLRDHDQVRQSLGEIESLEVNWSHSIALDDENTFVYDVKGSKASGEVTVKSITNDEGGEDIIWARLRLSNGDTIELDVD